ncbi:MAG: prolyl oligopeptidase family serine peptidase [Pirellula sp.]
MLNNFRARLSLVPKALSPFSVSMRIEPKALADFLRLGSASASGSIQQTGKNIRILAIAIACVILVAPRFSNAFEEPQLVAGKKFRANDSLKPEPEQNADAQECLKGLCWECEGFQVDLEPSDGKNGDWLVRFPSPVVSGDDINDRVAVEWYVAKDKNKIAMQAPAAVIVHESGSGMTVGRVIASALGRKGVHAFMVQLPHYGHRRGPLGKPTGDGLVTALKQGIMDVRRARDAVACLPLVDRSRISLQGTSLGGFVASTTAGMDRSFHRVMLLLSGGDLHGVMMNGKKDASKMRDELVKNGVSMDQMKEYLHTIEPLRLAHRIDPAKTWLFSGEFDDVVPLENAKILANKIPLDSSHHVIMPVDHYSGALLLPSIVQQMFEQIVAPE